MTTELHLPRGLPGRPRVDDRQALSGILHVLKTGCRWRDVPATNATPTTIYNRLTRWARRGVFSKRRAHQTLLRSFAELAWVSTEPGDDHQHRQTFRAVIGASVHDGTTRARQAAGQG